MTPLAMDSFDWSLDWFVIKQETRDIVLGRDFYLGPATWMFLGVLAAFLVTRAVTRLIRHRSSTGASSTGPIKEITIGGGHIHHQVFGICLMFVGGLLLVSWQPTGIGLRVVATVLGVGVGLAFDEFALWLHLDDVYWAQRGRKSIDAVALVLMLTACAPTFVLIVGVSSDLASFGEWALPIYLLIVFFVPAAFCLAKGKLLTAAAGVIYPPMASSARSGSPSPAPSGADGGTRGGRALRREQSDGSARNTPPGSITSATWSPARSAI
jgi:hypothetical protein